MHKSPLIQIVVFQLDIAAIQAVEDILSPWNQQPHNRAVFLGNGTRMISGVVPLRSTALLPAHRLPIQWNFAPV